MMTKNKTNILILAIAIIATLIAYIFFLIGQSPSNRINQIDHIGQNEEFILNEAGSIDTSTNSTWWLNAGGQAIFSTSTFGTIHGSLVQDDHWRKQYFYSDPVDTDLGYHPQNIFRLVNKGSWHDFKQEVYFRIDADNLSASPNRNESNGILLFNRYIDEYNLYYAGLRVDGTAVIKKKYKGSYTTLVDERVFPGTYSATSTSDSLGLASGIHRLSTSSNIDNGNNANTFLSPNLLPHDVWIGLRVEIATMESKAVDIILYTDIGETGIWTKVAEAVDDGVNYGPIIDAKAHAGIRTDFMDVSFKKYSIREN